MTSSATAVTPTISPSPTATPTPSIDPTVAAAEAAILEAYRGYWDEQVRILRDPTPYADLSGGQWEAVQQFAVDSALTNLASTAQLYAKNGIANVGEPVLDPIVSDIVLGRSAAIADCVDGTDWQPIYVATGESAAVPGQAPRLVINSKVLFYDDRWVVNGSVVDRETTC